MVVGVTVAPLASVTGVPSALVNVTVRLGITVPLSLNPSPSMSINAIPCIVAGTNKPASRLSTLVSVMVTGVVVPLLPDMLVTSLSSMSLVGSTLASVNT